MNARSIGVGRHGGDGEVAVRLVVVLAMTTLQSSESQRNEIGNQQASRQKLYNSLFT